MMFKATYDVDTAIHKEPQGVCLYLSLLTRVQLQAFRYTQAD